MAEHLTIKNFGPIPEADVDIRRVTIFIGSQGSGKSTISKLLTIFRDIFWRCAVIREENEYVMNSFSDFQIDKYFTKETYFKYTNVSGEIYIEYVSGKFTCKHVALNQEELLDDQLELVNKALIFFLQKMGYDSITDVKGTSEQKMLRANNRTLLYIPAERILAGQLSTSIFSLVSNKIPLSNPVMEYLSFFENARKKFPSYSIPFLKTQYKFEDGEEKVVVRSEDGRQKTLNLSDCSSGLQSVLPLLMVLEYCSQLDCFDSFVMEEPELNLFPSNQRELLNFILSRYDKRINMVITTHSPYVLSILNNFLFAAQLAKNPNIDKSKLDKIVAKSAQLDISDCAVYSLGKADGQDSYCVSIISDETGLIDVNFLDAVSTEIGKDFDEMQNLALQAMRASLKK